MAFYATWVQSMGCVRLTRPEEPLGEHGCSHYVLGMPAGQTKTPPSWLFLELPALQHRGGPRLWCLVFGGALQQVGPGRHRVCGFQHQHRRGDAAPHYPQHGFFGDGELQVMPTRCRRSRGASCRSRFFWPASTRPGFVLWVTGWIQPPQGATSHMAVS